MEKQPPLKANPPVQSDGRCVCCGGARPEVALRSGDPFCSSKCAREWHNQLDEPSRSKPSWQKARPEEKGVVRGFRSRHRLRTALGSGKGGAIAKVMIRCTETNEPVYTGISMDESTFESRDLGTKRVLCPDCGQEHTWDKDDAELEDE